MHQTQSLLTAKAKTTTKNKIIPIQMEDLSHKSNVFLLHRLVMITDKAASRLLQEKYGLSLHQCLLGICLKETNSLNQKQVAQFLNLTEAYVSKQVVSLKQLGLIKARQNPNNRSEKQLSLTIKGDNLFTGAMQNMEELFDEKVFSCLNKKESKQLNTTLITLNRQIENFCQQFCKQ